MSRLVAVAAAIVTLAAAVSCTAPTPEVYESLARMQSPEERALERAHPRVR